MAFARRDTGVIELQQSETVRDHSDDACHDFHTSRIRHQTLISMCNKFVFSYHLYIYIYF